jgi:hypothetical protein
MDEGSRRLEILAIESVRLALVLAQVLPVPLEQMVLMEEGVPPLLVVLQPGIQPVMKGNAGHTQPPAQKRT